MIVNWIELIQLFIGFFVANVLGYGGGPASIPLIYNEVEKYAWSTPTEFSNIIALGNALPGPISTKIAAYIGYDVAGIVGSIIALIATIVPSIIALIVMLKFLQKYRESKVVKGISLLVQPVIAMLMLVLTWQMAANSIGDIGWLQTIIIALVALWAMQKKKIHPAFVVLAAFIYGGFLLPYF
ncbi:chromate transporter [Paenibacillus endoradicis]|uniref:chromate transporter n=1 Tax=Paenibacillus endoradicis TaxID=2972487 RepID=UPI00280B4D75|nr:chromate transporter [Paenibacillus endoradicis]